MIIRGEIPSFKLWEDSDHIAILDINPNTKGASLVIPKIHYTSKVFDMPDEKLTKLMLATKKTAKLLEQGLNVERVGMGMDGTGVDHAHIKLYPMHGIDKNNKWTDERVFFENYDGYITTQLGPQASVEELKLVLQALIKN